MNEEVLYSLLSVAKSVDTTNGEIIKNMLICVNRENFDIYRKNYFKINGKNNGSLINKKKWKLLFNFVFIETFMFNLIVELFSLIIFFFEKKLFLFL